MKLFIVTILFFASSITLADYYSAADQVDKQREAQRSAAAQAYSPIANRNLALAIARFARFHRGLSSQLTPTGISESGVYYGFSFTTMDGWECNANYMFLKCANAQLGDKFEAVGWQHLRGKIK